MVRKKTKIKKNHCFTYLNQGGNPVRMSEMLRTALNISGLACHGLIKVYVRGSSVFIISCFVPDIS